MKLVSHDLLNCFVLSIPTAKSSLLSSLLSEAYYLLKPVAELSFRLVKDFKIFFIILVPCCMFTKCGVRKVGAHQTEAMTSDSQTQLKVYYQPLNKQIVITDSKTAAKLSSLWKTAQYYPYAELKQSFLQINNRKVINYLRNTVVVMFTLKIVEHHK